jgi:hypothetical protein
MVKIQLDEDDKGSQVLATWEYVAWRIGRRHHHGTKSGGFDGVVWQ